MENAWMNSLTEDWISQPRSDDSQGITLPPANTTLASQKGRRDISRIPLSNTRRQSSPTYNDNVPMPLSERSSSDRNIPASQRASGRASKPKETILDDIQSPPGSRTINSSTTGSVRHHTMQHKSFSTSTKKSKHEQSTPEWKRRLLHGEVAYGEQRDLFSTAGLENIFKPPPLRNSSPLKVPEEPHTEDTTLPSSPPLRLTGNRLQSKRASAADIVVGEGIASSKDLRTSKFTMVDVDVKQFSEGNLSRSSSFDPTFSTLENRPIETRQNLIPDGVSGQHEMTLLEPHMHAEAVRMPSGQSDIRHEDLSPIYVSRHNTVDGRIDYSALDIPANELQQRLKHLTTNDRLQSSKSDEGPSQILPENETLEHEDFTHIGEFVNLGRGGGSEDGSFQHRMLSPSSLPLVDESAMLCEASVEASTPKNLTHFVKQLQPDNSEMMSLDSVSSKVPRGPNSSPVETEISNSRQVAGSPLKLFGTYDTFTNQKLSRRLSQFENSMPQENICNKFGTSKLEEPQRGSKNPSRINEASLAPSSPSRYDRQRLQNINRFGDGDLDQFEFSEGSLESNRVMLEAIEACDAASSLGTLSQSGLNLQLESSVALENARTGEWHTRRINTPLEERTVHTRRSVTIKGSDSDIPTSRIISGQLEVLDTPRKWNGDGEGKRLLHSPPKNPTPKRRRTLHKTDISHAVLGRQISDVFLESHEQIQSVVGRKRKDARHEDSQEAADPQVLAMRQILRPRTLTSSQRSNRDKIDDGILRYHGSDNDRTRLEQREKIARVQAELDARIPSGTSSTSLVEKPMYSNSRKGSVTTQDFIDEAKEIMAGIRGKALLGSGLVSVEESECENEKQYPATPGTDQDDSYEESTKEPFSRPPSREGRPLPRLAHTQQDPELLDHLKKYEEMSDMDGIIASSLKSVDIAKDFIQSANNVNRFVDENINKLRSEDLNLDQEFQSDPPNIRITEYPELQRKRKHSNSTAQISNNNSHDTEFPSHGSNESSGPSTGRSVPTGSSRGSDSKHVIASHTVSHLIPEQLAGMTFDRQKHIWVKQRIVCGEEDHNDILQSEDTDDDPLGDIPDLTVDETEELSRVKAVAVRMRQEAQVSDSQKNPNPPHIDQFIPSPRELVMQIQTSKTVESATTAESVTLSRLVSRTTSQATQVTPWANASEPPCLQPSAVHKVRPSDTQDGGQEVMEEIEEEISINESRMEHVKYTPRRRNVTISFSSPIASIIPSDAYDSAERSGEGDASHSDSIMLRQSTRQRSFSSQSRSIGYTGPRKQCLTDRKFLARPVSRIDEHDEESFLSRTGDDAPQRSVSLVISTPLPIRKNSGHGFTVPASSINQYSDSVLQLTPLSDFSINQNDETFVLEVSYIGQHRRQTSSNSKKHSLSQSTDELVQRITDIEPYEPFWEHIKKIELRGKKLQTLHMLSKFCSHLLDLDVSQNDIGQLDGVPNTVRSLRIAHNCLSDLSSWSHLSNLQYVDVSNNGLKSLEGFKNLVHLRSLRADNNMIQCLKGITNLDGLITLRIRGNMIQYVDFAESFLPHLTDLDLKGNCIREIHNIQKLCSLAALNLEDNDIQTLNREDSVILWTLKYLKLGGNKLEYLDITQYPNIRLLYLDRNCFGRITGLLKAKHLDSISLREQKDVAVIDQGFLNEALEVRKLFLSGNLLTALQLSVDFLNLQYLELANCGLETLPHDFGQMTPNLRVLNLNYNAIRDISPLVGIVRLKKLHLAGNRLARLRKTTNVLAQFSTLTKIDLRNNPLTLGFYPPLTDRRIVIHDELDEERNVTALDPFTLPDGDSESDVAYAGRLDMGTKMRRRVYEILMLSGCVRLKMLDGLLLDRAHVGIRDKVWEELVKGELVYERGSEAQAGEGEAHLPDSAADEGDLGGENGSDPLPEDRWPAEDSFA